MKVAIALCVGVASFGPLPALAWGPVGHQVVANIAATQLTDKAKAQIGDLLGGDPAMMLAANATWADDLRNDRPETQDWHRVSIPLGAAGYDAARDCKNNACLVGQIDHDRAILADTKQPRPARIEALKFLIGFVGDIHQPLYTSFSAERGGNDISVAVAGFHASLQQVWDVRIVGFIGTNAGTVATSLGGKITPMQKADWAKGDAAAWANESFQLASTEVFPKFPAGGNLGDVYLLTNQPIVEMQLEKAGTRLAAVLNDALK